MTEQLSFVLYDDYSEYFGVLSVTDRGLLITAIFDYRLRGEIPEGLPPAVDMAFRFIRNQLDRDSEKYQERCRKNRDNGAKGGRPRKDHADEKTDRFSEKPKKPDNDNDTDTDTVTVTDLPPIIPPEGKAEEEAREGVGKEKSAKTDDAFSEFWRAYPKHTSKAEAKSAFDEIICTDADHAELMELLGRWKSSDEWKKENGRWIKRADRFLTELFPTRDGPPEPSISHEPTHQGSFDTDDFLTAALQCAYSDTA